MEGFSADPDPSAGVQGGRGRQLRAEQGKFWELHDQLFANQQALQPDFLKQYADGRRPGRREVRRVPRLGEVQRPRAGADAASAPGWA